MLIHADWRLYFYDLDLNRLKVLKLEPWELVGGEDPGDGLLEVNEDTSGKFLFARSWQVIFQVDCESLTLIHGYFLIFPKACGIRSVKWDRILRGLMVAAYFTYGKYREPLTPSQELIRDTPWLTPVIVPKADLQKMRDFNATERFFFCDIEARKLSLYPLQESIQTEIISFHKKFLQGVPVPLTIPEEDMAAKFSTPEFQQEFRYNLFMNFKNCYPLLYPLKNNTEFLCSKNGFLYRFGIDL